MQPVSAQSQSVGRSPETRPSPNAAAAAHGTPQTKTRILLADDDEAVRNSLRRVLEEAGFGVGLARDGREAIEKLQSEAPNLLVLDITMPHQNGWEIFEHVIVCHPELPVVIITGMAHQRQTEIARAAGAFLEKPLDVSVLLETLRASLAESVETRLQRRRAYLDGLCAISGAGNRGADPFGNPWSPIDTGGPANPPQL